MAARLRGFFERDNVIGESRADALHFAGVFGAFDAGEHRFDSVAVCLIDLPVAYSRIHWPVGLHGQDIGADDLGGGKAFRQPAHRRTVMDPELDDPACIAKSSEGTLVGLSIAVPIVFVGLCFAFGGRDAGRLNRVSGSDRDARSTSLRLPRARRCSPLLRPLSSVTGPTQ